MTEKSARRSEKSMLANTNGFARARIFANVSMRKAEPIGVRVSFQVSSIGCPAKINRCRLGSFCNSVQAARWSWCTVQVVKVISSAVIVFPP